MESTWYDTKISQEKVYQDRTVHKVCTGGQRSRSSKIPENGLYLAYYAVYGLEMYYRPIVNHTQQIRKLCHFCPVTSQWRHRPIWRPWGVKTRLLPFICDITHEFHLFYFLWSYSFIVGGWRRIWRNFGRVCDVLRHFWRNYVRDAVNVAHEFRSFHTLDLQNSSQRNYSFHFMVT